METKGHDIRSLKLVLTSLFAVLVLAEIASAGLTLVTPATASINSGTIQLNATNATVEGVSNNVSFWYNRSNTVWTLIGYGSPTYTSTTTNWNFTFVTSSIGEGNFTFSASFNATTGPQGLNTNSSNSTSVAVNNSYMSASALGPSGTVATTILTLTVTTSEHAWCYYNQSYPADAASLNFSTTGQGIVVHNQSITGTFGASTTYGIFCRSTAITNETVFTNTTFFAGASSGLVRRSTPATAAQNRETFTIPTVTAAKPATVTMVKNIFGITSIDVNVKNAVSSLRLVIEKKDTGPAGLSGVYKYMQITVDNLGTNLNNAVFHFKVPMSFYGTTLDPTTTKLSRYGTNGWEDLPTQSLGLSGSDYTYTATTTSFSLFAISAAAFPPAPVTPPAVTPPPTTPPTTTTAGPTDWTWLIIVVVVIIVLALAVFYTRGKKSYPIRSK